MDVLGNPLHDVDVLDATRPVHLHHAPTLSETRTLLQAFRDQVVHPPEVIKRMVTWFMALL